MNRAPVDRSGAHRQMRRMTALDLALLSLDTEPVKESDVRII